MEHLKQETVSGAQLNMDALYQICPQCFTESKDTKTGEVRRYVDFEKLRLLLGDNIAEGDERYDFTWVGKRAALQEAAKPIRKTLRPCPEESVDWENTKNLYIEGDNLEVLKLLQNSYMGKVKMIYIDPPYNTGNDFVYQDDFHQTKKEYDLFAGDVNEEGERLVKNTESNGRFHSDWCSMVYTRLMVARSLLTEDGVIFISMDDNEIENLRKVCDDVFGEHNFQSCVTWRRRTNQPNDKSRMIAKVAEYILVYAKNDYYLSSNKLFHGVPLSDKRKSEYSNPDNDPNGPWSTNPWKAAVGRGGTTYSLTTPTGITFHETWYGSKETFDKYLSENRVHWTDGGNGFPRIKIYLKDVEKEGQAAINFFTCEQYGSNQEGSSEMDLLFKKKGLFDNPKPTRLIKSLAHIATNEDSIIIDFFSGSATTADALMQLNAEDGGNRKFIMVQLPEETAEESEAHKAGYKNICEIGKERIRRAGKKILEEQNAKQGDIFAGEQKKVDVGFRVFKCADSNMKDVYYTPAEYSQELLLGLEDNIKEDRNDLDLLFGCMLDWGVTLDLPLRTEKVDGINIHIVNEGDLVACFEKHIPESVIDHIASLLPMRVVLRDSCFDEAKEKMNFFEIFKQRTGWSEEEVRKNVKVI